MGSGGTAPPPAAWARYPPAGPHRAQLFFLLAASLREAPPLLPASPPARPLLPGRTPRRSTPAAGGAALQSAFAVPLPSFFFFFPPPLPPLPWPPRILRLGAEAGEEAGVATEKVAAATPLRGWPGFPAGGAPFRVRHPPW